MTSCYFSGHIYGLKLHEIQCTHKARLCLYAPGMPMNLTPLQPVFEVSLPYSPVLACGKPLGLSSCFVLSQRPLGSDHYFRAHCCRFSGYLGNQSFILFAQHISSLKLEGSNLASTQLEAIAGACPNLKHLDIAHCTDALKSLQGLAAVAYHCPKLKGINANYIHDDDVEDIRTFWDILSRIKNLVYLTVTACLLSPEIITSHDGSLAFTLQALQIASDSASIPETRGIKYCYLSDCQLPLLSNMMSLKCLRILDLPPGPMRAPLGQRFGEFFNKLQHLTYLYISFSYKLDKSEPQRLTLPTEASCYTSLEQIHIRCWNFHVSEALVQALVHSGKLTHVFLLVGSISQTALLELVQRSPRLAIGYVYMIVKFNGSEIFKETLHSIVESQKIDEFSFHEGACHYDTEETFWFVDSVLQHSELHPFHEFHYRY